MVLECSFVRVERWFDIVGYVGFGDGWREKRGTLQRRGKDYLNGYFHETAVELLLLFRGDLDTFVKSLKGMRGWDVLVYESLVGGCEYSWRGGMICLGSLLGYTHKAYLTRHRVH